ncbi:cadherin-23-like isoform X1 [Daphnia carinata]|uniref:cadherin-23-like isoform X1 n=1 Tax=Daphnia carinata TaxID=120202 RepID=UPI00257DB0B7|nr:cadherin-23-like isoform X1 [Daphnia carinata]
MACPARIVSILMALAALVAANQPPRFEVTDESGGEIVLKLKEGAEGTPVGSVIYRIKASDADGDALQFGLQGHVANELLRIQPVSRNEADLQLIKELDRETEEEYSLVLTVTDGKIGAGQAIRQSLLIIVEDVNDNRPVFQPFANTLMLRENAPPAVILTVEATDRDQGVYGQVVYSLEGMEGEDGIDEETAVAGMPFSITTVGGKGILRCLTPLDYERRSWYQLRILAKDQASDQGRINTATAGLLVRLIDEDDQGPEFITVPSVTRVAEDAQPGTSVLRVKAIDGDRGVNQRIIYSLDPSNQYFAIDPKDGVVYLIQQLDREDPNVVNGALMLIITATEDSPLRPSVTTEVTILVLDVNDQAPAFRTSGPYVAEVDENAPANVPVTFLGSESLPEVYDYDQGKNGTFYLTIRCDDDLFDISPGVVVNEALFSIRVKSHLALDYEELTGTNCTITAREAVAKEAKTTTVSVSIRIRDVNDHIPQFTRPSYQVQVRENAAVGTIIGSVVATDADSGQLGTDGIRYSLLPGSIADALEIDPLSGAVSIGRGASGLLDREKVSQLIVMVEARDSLGLGNRNTVQFTLELEDVNDNAPVFIQSHFEIYINENELNFPYTFTVEAFDRDLNDSDNSRIRYSIIDGDLQSNFSIHRVTGELSVVHPLDFELLAPSMLDTKGLGHVRPINLTVRASDMGTPPLHTDTRVVIFVHDVNDFAPTFTRPSYSVAVAEDAAPDSSILQVQALDMDGSSPNNVVAYRIQSGARDKFVIDSTTGIVSVALGATLDPDQTHPRTVRYQLEILALDGGVGSRQLHASVTVMISVADVNNKPPVLVEPGVVRVQENVPVGVVLTQLTATDPDERPIIRYWIDHAASEGRNEMGFLVRDENVTSWFEINTNDGRIRVVRQMDREKAETIRLAIRAEDVAAATIGQTASGTMTIILEDVNDHDPIFIQPFYRRSVAENSKRGAPILTLSADDADLNRSITYSLDGPADLLELIHLNSETGEVVVSGKIDRERFAWMNLTAKASDSGMPRRSSFVPVFIQVLDENDNNPQFASVPGNFSVRENSPPGTVIGTVQAFDVDAGDFGHVTYLMDRRSSKGRFSVDPETGVIMVTEPLDREEQQSYTLILEAWDNYRVGYSAGESRNAFQQVTVQVMDENDETPVFEARSGCVSVTEFHDARVPLTTIHASDRDDPTTPNGHIVFSIQEGNGRGLFSVSSIDHSSARLIAVQPLVGHHGNYTLRVRAQDRGPVPNVAFQDVELCVSDYNDHAPVFVRPEQNNTTFRVYENTTVGSIITSVSAIDEDAGLNSQVRYSIRLVGNWKWFGIDSVTGEITLLQPLDREKQKLLQIRIEARDSGIPTWLSTDLDLTIYVRNINDHQPQFPLDIFQINITEHDPSTDPIQLPETVDLDEPDELLSARDPVCYYIVGGNQQGAFSLDRFQHTLTVEKTLDREEQASHIIVVKASENCDLDPDVIDSFDPADDSLLKVVVNLKDINDNPPTFERKVFTAGLTTDADFGSEVVRVIATDPDVGLNAKLSYSIRKPVKSTLLSRNGQEEHIGVNPFVIDRETGIVSLNFDPQRDMKGYFDMEVYVNDSDGYSDSARVLVYLLRHDQRVKFVLRQHPQFLRTRIDQFKEALGNITGAIVNVDELKVHSNEDGQLDKTRTDAYLHFVNANDNSVMEVDAVLRLIDANVESLDQLFKDYNVLDTSAAEPLGDALTSSPQNFSLLWASGTAVFLAMILLLVLGLCVSQRFILMRKLKAASATAFGSQSNVNRTSNQVPNTNQHTVEGSNPVWRSELEPEWFKHEDIYSRSGESDGLDSLDVNAILGNAPPTSRNSSDANTASLKSTTTEAFNRSILQRNANSIRSNKSVGNVTLSEKECEIGEVKEEDCEITVGKGLYQRNVYHFGYPVFQQDKGSTSSSTTFLSPRKLETTEL